MLTVHHLETSRSHRVLWLLEELGTPYVLQSYARDPLTRLAPPALRAVHPLGKSPVLTDGDITVAESAAILEYLLDTYGEGRFRPAPGTAAFRSYTYWMHFAEGSAMLPLLLKLYSSFLGDAAAPLQPRIDSEIASHFAFMEGELTGRDYACGAAFTAADVQLSYVLEGAAAAGALEPFPVLSAYLARLRARPAYQIAVEKGGPIALKRR